MCKELEYSDEMGIICESLTSSLRTAYRTSDQEKGIGKQVDIHDLLL